MTLAQIWAKVQAKWKAEEERVEHILSDFHAVANRLEAFAVRAKAKATKLKTEAAEKKAAFEAQQRRLAAAHAVEQNKVDATVTDLSAQAERAVSVKAKIVDLIS